MDIIKKALGRPNLNIEPGNASAFGAQLPDNDARSHEAEPPAGAATGKETGGGGPQAGSEESLIIKATDPTAPGENQDRGFPQKDILELFTEIDTRDERLQRLAAGLEQVDVHVLALESNLVATELRMRRRVASPNK
jgi:hypothetical protein